MLGQPLKEIGWMHQKTADNPLIGAFMRGA
jgi:hypothetical protein